MLAAPTLTPSMPPLVAILRGLAPADAADVGRVLIDAGFRILEVPLNRPGALDCIATLASSAPEGVLIGGGTMLTVADVDAVHGAGGRLLVSPNCNPAVIAHAAALGMYCAPGVATPTEAFAALDAGAHALKIFPADMVGQAGLRTLKSVLPAGIPVWPVGGVAPEDMAAWRRAGATGFGIGSQLYQPGVTLDVLAQRAQQFIDTWNTSTETPK